MTDLLQITVINLAIQKHNVEHIARHGITHQDVTDVMNGEYAVRPAKLGRYAVVGTNRAERCITLVIVPTGEPGDYQLVTARPAQRSERHSYLTRKLGGESHD
jgi:uncharacterized DUF497 family protein